MATKNYYVTRDQRHPLYKNRMLTAGVPYAFRESVARWFETHFGVELTDQAPKRAAAKAEAPTPVEEAAPAPAAEPAPKPSAKKAPAKKATRRKKSA